MSQVKITALPAASTIAATDLLVIVHDPSGTAETQKVALSSLLAVTTGTPSGTINGSNAAFTVVAPIVGLFLVFLNGALQTGGGVDYTRVTTTITFVTAPPTGSTLTYVSL